MIVKITLHIKAETVLSHRDSGQGTGPALLARAKDIARCCGCGRQSWVAVADAPSTARWRICAADLVAWSSRMLYLPLRYASLVCTPCSKFKPCSNKSR